MQKTSANRPTNPRHANKSFETVLPVNVDPGHDACIVDWFFVTDFWSEKRRVGSTMGIVWMVRLEKMRLGEQSYWPELSQHPPTKIQRHFEIKAPKQICKVCQQGSPCIFNEGCICRNEQCNVFRILGDQVPDKRQLTFCDRWLQQREWVDDVAPQPSISTSISGTKQTVSRRAPKA